MNQIESDIIFASIQRKMEQLAKGVAHLREQLEQTKLDGRRMAEQALSNFTRMTALEEAGDAMAAVLFEMGDDQSGGLWEAWRQVRRGTTE